MTEKDISEGPKFMPGLRPKNLDPNGLFSEGHVVEIDGGQPTYIPAGPGIANLENCGHDVKVLPRYTRKHIDHTTGGAKD